MREEPIAPEHLLGEADEVVPQAAGAAAARTNSLLDRAVLRGTAWLAEHPKLRVVIAVAVLALALAPGVLLFFSDVTDDLEGFGYFGVFLTNLASTATLFIPVPGLTAAGQALIITEGQDARFPWLVGVAGGAGMAIGEITAYYAGRIGAELARGRELPGPKRFHATIERVVRAIEWLMDRWGMATLFVLSAIPNPVFELAGVTAGSVRMPFRRFFVSVAAGKLLRGVLLAYVGYALPFV